MVIFKKEIEMITHIDLDGVGPYIIHRHFGMDAHVQYVNNGEVDAKVEAIIDNPLYEDHTLIITDHSPTLRVYNRLVKSGIDFYIFDHHESSQLAGTQSKRVILDYDWSATWLYYQFCETHFPNQISDALLNETYNLARLIDDWDTWKHQDKMSTKLNTLFGATDIQYITERFIRKPALTFNATESAIIRATDKEKQRYYKQMTDNLNMFEDDQGRVYAFVFTERYQFVSELFHKAIKEFNLHYMVGIDPVKMKGSIRADADTDVLTVIHALNESHPLLSLGGHTAAGGFAFTADKLVPIIQWFGGEYYG